MTKSGKPLLKETSEDVIKKMHGDYGNHLELTSPSRVFDLAYHFDAANLHQRALPHSIKAAELARKKLLTSER